MVWTTRDALLYFISQTPDLCVCALQAAGILGIALTILPDIFNLAIVVILLYAAIISCAPIFNDLMWSPDEGIPPPIRGKKWEDFDPEMQVRSIFVQVP
jgi:hypothetical protein